MDMNASAGDPHDPVKTDFRLIVEYLFDCLSPEQVKLVQVRLVEDVAFFRMFVRLERRVDANPPRGVTLLRAFFERRMTSAPSSERKMPSGARKGISGATAGASGSSSGQLDFAINQQCSSNTNRPTDDMADSVEQIDPDFALLVDYTIGNLSPEQEAVVEGRLVEDEAFFKVWVPVAHIHNVLLDTKGESRFTPPPLPVTWHEPH
jgi:hypothetical protein